MLSYAVNRDLGRYLVAKRLKGDWGRKALICASVIEAVNYIHSEKIVHGDLKAANVLLDEHLNPRVINILFDIVYAFTFNYADRYNYTYN